MSRLLRPRRPPQHVGEAGPAGEVVEEVGAVAVAVDAGLQVQRRRTQQPGRTLLRQRRNKALCGLAVEEEEAAGEAVVAARRPRRRRGKEIRRHLLRTARVWR